MALGIIQQRPCTWFGRRPEGFYAGQVARPGWSGQVGRREAPMPGRFAETLDGCPPTDFFHSCPVGDNLDFFFLGRIPTLARAPMPGRCSRGGGFNAGQVVCPQDDDPPRCPGNLAFVKESRPCYMCYMCYMATRQATEPPLSTESLLYVLYVLYGSYKASH